MLISYLRALILFLVLIVCIRLMGKRQPGEARAEAAELRVILEHLRRMDLPYYHNIL